MSEEEEKDPEYQFPMQFGQYKLIDLIGIGGMGEVFLAEDPICQRKVALKRILPPHFDKPYHYERFIMEPKIAAQLAHPFIIPIYSLNIEPRDLYYTMPYIEGESLRDPHNLRHNVVISSWRSLPDWDRWVSSPIRERVLAMISPMLEEPEKITVLQRL